MRQLRRLGITIFVAMKDAQNSSIFLSASRSSKSFEVMIIFLANLYLSPNLGITIFVAMKDAQNSSIKDGAYLTMSGCMRTLDLLSVNTEIDLLLKNAISKSTTGGI